MKRVSVIYYLVQVAGFAFLLSGVAMFAYQMWAWWRHTSQVWSFLELSQKDIIAAAVKQQTLLIDPRNRADVILSRFARAVKGID